MSDKSDASTGRSYRVNFKMNNKVLGKDSVEDAFDDDAVELNTLEEDPSIFMGNKKKVKKRRKTSIIWNYFDIIPNIDLEDMEIRAKCKLCGNQYKVQGSNGYGNLNRHIEVCGGNNTPDVRQMLLVGSEGSLSVSASEFDPERYRELLVAAIIQHDLPFSYVEYDDVREMHQYLRSDVPFISKDTVKADLVKMHLREKQRVKSMLNACPGRICLISNLWTSLTTDRYMCLTVHFINKYWVLTKRVLNFSFIPSPHDDISLFEKINNLLQEWGIQNKILTITLDNAFSNDVCVGLLKQTLNIKKALLCDGEFFHLHCYAYILNLIVQDGLKEINDVIQKIRDSVKYVRGSQVRKQNFLQAVNQMSLDSNKELRQDVPTEWDSTYLMLESALHYQRAFSYLEMTDSSYQYCPTALEWEKVNDISSFLTCFYKATCAFSGTKYPTANLYFPVIAMIYVTLKQHLVSEDEHKSLMATQMISKFEKYWSEFSTVLAIAVIFDPRYKLHFVNYCYMKIYGVKDSVEFVNVRDKLFQLFMEHSTSSRTLSSIVVQPQEHCQKLDWEKEYLAFCETDVNSQKNQLEIYLEEPRFLDKNGTFDVLSFWKGAEFCYPEVAAMARDILSIPVSTIPSESIFSIGERVIDQYKSSLKPNIIEALVCTKDWLYGEQEHTQMKLDGKEDDVLTMNVNSCDIPSLFGAQSFNIS